jgi:hypothetical protein
VGREWKHREGGSFGGGSAGDVIRRPIVLKSSDYVSARSLSDVLYRMTRIKRNPCLGWEIFIIESEQMKGI